MDAETTQRGGPEPVLVRRSGQGWQVGSEETADLTSAMVLADLLAGDLGSPAIPVAGGPGRAVRGDSTGPRGRGRTRRRGWP